MYIYAYVANHMPKQIITLTLATVFTIKNFAQLIKFVVLHTLLSLNAATIQLFTIPIILHIPEIRE